MESDKDKSKGILYLVPVVSLGLLLIIYQIPYFYYLFICNSLAPGKGLSCGSKRYIVFMFCVNGISIGNLSKFLASPIILAL